MCNNISKNNNAILWQKAAIIGSLWASVEIIFGSFLHNLKIPFSGLILASIGVFILTATSRYWNERGLIVRIGIICALMKSISPSAVIFGPMIGILFEAAIFEFSTMILGRNTAGFIIAGGFAVSSVLLQQIIFLFIIYGFDLIPIFDNMYQIAANTIGNPGVNSIEIIIILFLLEFLFGVVSVLLALRIGISKTIYYINNDNKNDNNYSFYSGNVSETSFLKLFLNLFLIILLLFLFKYLDIYYSLILAAAFIVYGYKFYSIKSLNNPKYILEFGFVVLFSGLIMRESSDSSYWISKSGIFTGVEMILRASVLIIGFSLVSCELRNPAILEWVFKRKLKQLYRSLELAFSTLPLMIEIISKKKESMKKPAKNISYLLSVADFLIKRELSNKNIFIVSGEINSGKSSFLSELLLKLKQNGLRIGGIFSQAIYSNGNKIGYDLINQFNNEKIKFMRLNNFDDDISFNCPQEKGYTIGRFIYSEEALNFGKKAFTFDYLENVDVIIIDEVGPSELSGALWTDSLNQIMKIDNKIIVLVVRQSILEGICEKFQIFPAKIFYPTDDLVLAASEILAIDTGINKN